MTYTTWGQIADLAGKAGAKFPQLVAAQWALESSYGTAVSGVNNFFGIKGDGTAKTTTEYSNGKPIQIVDQFMDFKSPDDCINYLVSRWYKDYKDYKGINRAESREEAANLLQKEGYATDPAYSQKLIDIMKKNTPSIEISKPVSESIISLSSAARWYSAKPHQDKAWAYLETKIGFNELKEFAKLYRNSSSPVESVKINHPSSTPYFYQRDSKTGQGERSCQSSAIAMAVKYFKPNIVTDDDDYLKTVLRYGDTVSQTAQKKALDYYGVNASFHQDGSESMLIRLLDLGCPVPIGILHKGPVSNPIGGGHWITLIDYDDNYFYVNDPFGELDLINGGYPKNGPTDGKNQKYSRTNLMKRWMINGSNDGWYWSFEGEKNK
jgi:hypothetical protein